MFTFSDCNIVLRSFGVYPTLGKFVLSASGSGEKTFDSLDLLEAETKIPTIKSPLTNNSAKHNLAFLEERRSPDERIRTNREPINIQCNNQSIKRGLICQYIQTANRSIHKNLLESVFCMTRGYKMAANDEEVCVRKPCRKTKSIQWHPTPDFQMRKAHRRSKSIKDLNRKILNAFYFRTSKPN